jgi:sigma-E factor negative regulatory protein RseA
MDDTMQDKELISALADGQLQGEAFARAMETACAGREALETWHAYHLIGDVLRSRELAAGAPASPFMEKLSRRLAQEQVARPAAAAIAPIAVRAPERAAANDGSFRWKMVAGVASVAAFAAVGWSMLGTAIAPAGTVQPQFAVAPQPAANNDPVSATVLTRAEPGVMIRDPKLDEMLAAHRQFGGPSALQSSAGFLRSATFEGPAR